MLRDRSLFSCILLVVIVCVVIGIVRIVKGNHFEKLCTETLQGEVIDISKESWGMAQRVSVKFELDGLLHTATNLVSYKLAKQLSVGEKVVVYYNPKDKTQFYAVDYCAFDVFSVVVALCCLVILGYVTSKGGVECERAVRSTTNNN